METIYFLIITGVIAFAIVWFARRPKTNTDLAARKARKDFAESDKLLKTPAGHRLSRKEELWEERRRQARKGHNEPGKFVPKFQKSAEPEYDGYSRRDRHHVTSSEHVKEESHI
jgi:hypothetical protein